MESRASQPGRGHSARTGMGSRVLWTIAMVVLLGLVLFLTAERNSRRYQLALHGDELMVRRGLLFPIGWQRFKTDDPSLAEAYAPLKLPSGAGPVSEQHFDDRAGLDQALYELLARWARDDIATEDPRRLERGLRYLDRADRLAGLSAKQRQDLRALRAESGFYEAQALLQQGTVALQKARDWLRLTSDSTNQHSAQALVLWERLIPLVTESHRLFQYATGRPTLDPPAAPSGEQNK